MNMNDAVSAKNRELVYQAAQKYREKYGEIPKQAHIMAQCPGMSKQTAKKYRKEWLDEKGLVGTDDAPGEYSSKLRIALDDEIRERKAIAHKKIHDELQSLDEANETLIIQNEHITAQLTECKLEIVALKEEKASFAAQAELLGVQVEKLQNFLKDSTDQLASIQEQYEKRMEVSLQSEREALERECIAREELAALSTSITIAKSESALAELLDKALRREEWFAKKFVKRAVKSLPNSV